MEIDKNIEELVEWAASEVLKAFYPDMKLPQDGSELILLNLKCYKAAKQILSHPNLAWIAGKKLGHIYGCGGKEGRYDYDCYPVILLKEALKRSNNEGN